MNALPEADRTKLAKLLGMLGSAHAGERDAAACAAHRLVQQRGITWHDVVTPPLPQPAIAQHRYQTDHIQNADLVFCQQHASACTDWEQEFVRSVSMRRSMSQKQRDVVARIAESLRGRGFL